MTLREQRIQEDFDKTKTLKELWIQVGSDKALALKKQWIQEGFAQGMEKEIVQAIERGIDQGIEQGVEEGVQLIAKKLLANGMSIEKIIQITGFSLAEIEKLKGIQNIEK